MVVVVCSAVARVTVHISYHHHLTLPLPLPTPLPLATLLAPLAPLVLPAPGTPLPRPTPRPPRPGVVLGRDAGVAEYLLAGLLLVGGFSTKLVSVVKNVASTSGGGAFCLKGESAACPVWPGAGWRAKDCAIGAWYEGMSAVRVYKTARLY